MIKEKELQDFRPQTRFSDGEGVVTLQTIRESLQNSATEKRIPVAFQSDQVKHGGMIGGKTEDCLVLYHPEHEKDYFKICIRVKYQGSYAFVSANSFGTSKLMKSQDVQKAILSTAKEGLNRAGKRDFNVLNNAVAGAAYIGAVGTGIHKLVKGRSDKEKLEIEKQWYTIISDIFDEILN